MNSNYLKCIKVFLLSLFSDFKEKFEYLDSKVIHTELAKKFRVRKKYGFVYSGFVYRDKIIKDLIWQIKFRKKVRAVLEFKEFMNLVLKSLVLGEKINSDAEIILIPVPLHRKRLKERGFNQAELIANLFLNSGNVVSVTKISVRNDLIKRINYSVKQSWKNKQARVNQKNPFLIVNPEIFDGKIIIIVDDVVTTGTTLQMIKTAIESDCCPIKIFAITVAN